MKHVCVLALCLAIVLIAGSPQLLAVDDVKVPLVLYQNTGDPYNEIIADFAAANPDLVVGFVNVHLEEDGSLLIIVHVKKGIPYTLYDFNIKGKGTFADKLVTNSKGVGNAIYTLPPEGFTGTGSVLPVFAFDMMPTGIYPPLDDTVFQSAKVDLTQ